MNRISKSLMALAAMLVAFAVVPHAPQPAQAENGAEGKKETVKSVSDASFKKEVLQADKLVLVDFWAPWCGPCRMQGPIIEEVSAELGDKMKVVKLNTDENPKTAGAYKIRGIPALKFFKNGKEVDSLVGLRQKDELLSTIKKYL